MKTTSLADLRKNRSALMQKVNSALSNNGQSDRKEDDRFWKPTRDSAGSGSAIIRFLPPMKDDDLPWITLYTRSFKVEKTGRWYINNDLSTIGEKDPVYEYIKPIYESKDEDEIKKIKNMKRGTSYVSNILVIKDPANPENEGKVFYFKYGKKIYEMIQSKAQPTFDDQDPVYVYDIDEGANFRLRVKTVDQYPNYDSSEFDAPKPLCDGDDDKIENVIEMYRPLKDLLKKENFKSYDDLKGQLDRALGLTCGVAPKRATDVASEVDSDQEVKIPKKAEKVQKQESAPWDADDEVPVKETKKPEAQKPKAPASSSIDDDDDDVALFQSMLNKG